MSQKTIYPGMPSGNPGQAFESSNPFAQSFDAQSPFGGTVYPGMPGQPTQVKAQGRTPIMGFFYSVSKNAFGEYWPLYEGPNKIGRNEQNTVVLKEASVSDFHATITIRRMKKGDESLGVSVFLQDNNSMVGTMLNGETLDYNPRGCKDGDIITVGANYELYLILVDADKFGLAPKSAFTPTSDDMGFAPDAPFTVPGGEYMPEKGTIGGTGGVQNARSTVYMPGAKK